MPFDVREYHPDWSWIRQQILDQADHRCEQCAVPNYAVGIRDTNGHFWAHFTPAGVINAEGWHEPPIPFPPAPYSHETGEELCRPAHFERGLRIVLTIAHMDGDKTNDDPSNLRALCQRCHLNHDRPHHLEVQAANRVERRQARIRATGQLSLQGE